MENPKKNKIIIVVIIVIIVILSVLCILLATNTISFRNNQTNTIDNDNNNQSNESNSNNVYNKGDEIVLNDGSKWMVLNNSLSNQDYVTAIADEAFTEDFEYDNWDAVSKEFYGIDKIAYNDSYMKKELEQYYLPKISAKLKHVDGYKIRLITLDEILKLNDGWKYDKEHDSYTYTGSEKINNSVLSGITMTNTKCTDDKCTAFYVITVGCESYDSCDNPEYYIEHWSSGLPNLVPVINVYKTEIRK